MLESFITPPILPDVEEQLKKYLLHPEELPIHDYECTQLHWPREPDITELFHYDNSPISTTLKVQRDPFTGQILEFREVKIPEPGLTGKNSTSYRRAPGPPREATRGSASNYPFWPGGFPDPILTLPTEENIDLTKDLLTIPPGFSRGLQFRDDGRTLVTDSPPMISPEPTEEIAEFSDSPSSKINLMAVIKEEQDLLGLWSESENKNDKLAEKSTFTSLKIDDADFIPEENELPVLKITDTVNKTFTAKKDWAEMIDVNAPVLDFEKRIPDPAITYKFTLDNFQKQAILKLEEHSNVFVAAHTSAGKTVVAEYAIALSKHHKTRTVYTSPIKALSNQKYRDFKMIFEDVGLITGDFQINQTASCLIMTTEILRSMLYCGSDVTRDLEYVIFDEVHYVNNSDRGHVWEEVLILLPSHVTIVMLSATVPNTLEFANWVGSTKKSKVYVISTLKRPVPLVHYLYTNTGGGNSKEVTHKILDANGRFDTDGYKNAVTQLKNQKQSAFVDRKTLWTRLIKYLEKQDKIPVVAFTLSRKKCDENANFLSGLNLNTKNEMHEVKTYFRRCIEKLKDSDKQLPQVLKMQTSLESGIGVHHSGILPILKEIVEMLFQKGLVKILFATETFAMGVNMPTRTVVFDKIRKFDGLQHRELFPAEYIQMAGRAGRRGLDDNGTVIIICGTEAPPVLSLRTMMLGIPEKLSSQFRITYGMILNLVRMEFLTVENMMQHSFREMPHRSQHLLIEKDLKKTKDDLSRLPTQIPEYFVNISSYHKAASYYLDMRNQIWGQVLQNVIKDLTPGRVLLISHRHHVNKLGLILNTQISQQNQSNTSFTVLVLNHRHNSTSEDESESLPEEYYKILSLTNDEVFQPDGVGGHQVIKMAMNDIIEVTNKVIKLDMDLVLKDCDKRQIARFRDDPPAPTCHQAIQELTKITHSMRSKKNDSMCSYIDIKDKLKTISPELFNNLKTLEQRRNNVNEMSRFTKIANFEKHLADVDKRIRLENRCTDLNFKLSNASMSLYPDYKSKLALLSELDYVDSDNAVKLKGRVACEIGTNNLIVTELIFQNILTNMTPAEVASLLSCLVFQAKTDMKQNLTKELEEGKKAMEEIEKRIEELERKYEISTQDPLNASTKLNFKLMEVVYEWAQQKPFADIMKRTDIQEGIIVRCIQQLNETLRDVKDAARIIGDPKLQIKMDEASNAIKRDIVFAASLYTT